MSSSLLVLVLRTVDINSACGRRRECYLRLRSMRKLSRRKLWTQPSLPAPLSSKTALTFNVFPRAAPAGAQPHWPHRPFGPAVSASKALARRERPPHPSKPYLAEKANLARRAKGRFDPCQFQIGRGQSRPCDAGGRHPTPGKAGDFKV